jgi:signal transduction histidine kinase
MEEADLAEALGAIAENAARHARSCVTLSARRAEGRVMVSVADDGPGIPAHRRAELIARHGRADETGTGLGLAIAADIAEAAGGELRLSDAAPGLVVTLVLP